MLKHLATPGKYLNTLMLSFGPKLGVNNSINSVTHFKPFKKSGHTAVGSEKQKNSFTTLAHRRVRVWWEFGRWDDVNNRADAYQKSIRLANEGMISV